MNAPKDLFHIYASITIDQSRNQVSIYFGSESSSKTKKKGLIQCCMNNPAKLLAMDTSHIHKGFD